MASEVELRSNHKIISVTPAVEDGTNYADGDLIGGLQTLQDALAHVDGSGFLQWVTCTSKADIAAGVPIDVLVFNARPSATTFTENGAIAIDGADAAKVIGVAKLTDRTDMGTPIILQPGQGLAMPVRAADGRTLYAAAVIRGAANLASTSDLTFRYVILPD